MNKAHWARFRVFHGGTMYYPSDDEYDRQQRIFGESKSAPCLTMDGEGRLCYVEPYDEYNRNEWHELKDAEFMLCTGIEAQTERLIYEYDYVRAEMHGIGPRHGLPFLATTILYEVVREEPTTTFILQNAQEDLWVPLRRDKWVHEGRSGVATVAPYTIEIIGNRFETPELWDKVYRTEYEDKEVNNARP